MPEDRRAIPSIVLLVFVGFIGVFTLTQRPRFQAYHTVDVLQLLVSGICFGVALTRALLVIGPRRRR